MAFIILLLAICQTCSVTGTTLGCLEAYCPASAVTPIQRGNHNCDQGCLSPMCGFDSLGGSSDCQSLCHCATLGDGTCEDCKSHAACNTPECQWDGGDCSSYCSPGCKLNVGNAGQLGDGTCDLPCNTELCYWDFGDCVTAQSPVKVYVGANETVGPYLGTWANPYNSLVTAVKNAWAPYTIIYLLKGQHYLQSESAGSNLVLTISVPFLQIQPFYCTDIASDHSKCTTEPVTLQMTKSAISFLINTQLTVQDVTFKGGFSLKDGCSSDYCTYCPAVHFNETTRVMNNDRSQAIGDYAPQALCDAYKTASLFQLNAQSILNLTNVRFDTIRHQPLALILNQCGNLAMTNVTFSNITPRRLGLSGGVIQQVNLPEYEPYYCGSFAYTGGLVEKLNNGYEYSDSNLFSGFVWLVALQSIAISNVTFRFNFVQIGQSQQIYGSALMFIRRFREMKLQNCVFNNNIADTGAALYIYTALTIPLVVKDGIASEQALLHLQILDNYFTNNTGRAGSVILIRFLTDRQNVLMRNNTFVSNFATEGAIVELSYGALQDRYTIGQNLSVQVNDTLIYVFVPPILTRFINLTFRQNYSPLLCSIASVANFLLSDSTFVDNGDSPAGLNSNEVVIRAFAIDASYYLSLVPRGILASTCTALFLVTNSYSASISQVQFESISCVKGSPGISLSGTTRYVIPKQINLKDLVFRACKGAGLLSLTTAYDLTITGLTFLYNKNIWNERSVCLDISQTAPALIEIKDSVFRGNLAVYGTLAKVTGARGVLLNDIEAVENTALSTSAGILFTPLADMDSSITVVNSQFRNNTSLRSGVIVVTETSGNMLFGSSHVTITIKNNTFADNHSQYSGCSLTILGFVVLSQNSLLSDNKYVRNRCDEGGAGLYVTFVSGIMTLENSLFEGNVGEMGVAVYSTHQGADDFSTYLRVRNCSFTENYGVSMILITGAKYPLLLTETNVFKANNGTCICLNAAQWQDSASSYQSNQASEGGVFTALDYSTVTIKHMTAVSNSVSIKGGVASVSMHSTVQCEDCAFRNNSCARIGGVISIDQQSEFACIRCGFNGNKAGDVGAIAYSIFSSLTVSNSTLSDNHAESYGSIMLVESALSLFSSEMAYNSANARSPGIVCSMSNLTIRYSSFHSQSGYTGTFIFAAVSNKIAVFDSEFYDSTGISGAVFYVVVNSTLTVTNSQVHDCSSKTDGGILQTRGSTITLQSSLFWNIQAPYSNGAFYLILSTLKATDSSFKEIKGSVVVGQSSYIHLSGVEVRNAQAAFGSGVNCVDCYSLNVSNSRFYTSKARLGGVIYSYSAGFLSDALTTSFQNSSFEGNIASMGGAIYINSVFMESKGNTFRNNSADISEGETSLGASGIGGALYCACEFLVFCEFKITGNKFERNSAFRKGGALHWADSYPTLASNVMQNNSAPYGADISSFPIRLSPYNALSGLSDYLLNGSIPLAGTLQNVGSGHISAEVLQYALVDHYGNIASADSTSSAQILTSAVNMTISGNTQAIASNGVFTFTQLTFKAEPSTQQAFQVTTTAISQAVKIYTKDPSEYIPTVEISADFRACSPGESLQNQECYLCPVGTFSLNPVEPCNSCPNNVICYGNYTMVPEPGYWRPDPSLNLFFQCPNADACIGSPTTVIPLSLTGLCATGYSGNLCSICSAGYSANGRHECSLCPSFTANIIVSALIVLTALALGACAIVISIRSASRPRSELAIHLKIFMNYLQMVVVAASLNLNWPEFVSMFLNGQDTAGSVSEQLFSFDCLLQKVGVSSVYFTKMEGNALLPAVLLLFAGFIWILISICLKISLISPKIIASLVMILFILHPSLTKEMFSMFACVELKPGELWLVADLSLRCWGSEHIKYALMVSVTSIGVWILGLPLACLCFIYRYRNRLADPTTQLKFSFLYKGYQAKWYFWEFVILYRKVALVCASVFLSTVSIMVQALSVLAVLLVSLFFQLQLQPFATPTFNRLELKSILVSAVTIYSGLFYQTQDISKR